MTSVVILLTHNNIVFYLLITSKITCRVKSDMTRKVPKIKNFYESVRRIPTMHSTWLELMELMSAGDFL